MACNNQEYFTGNGEVLIRKRASDCGAATEGFRKLGDANQLLINFAQSFGDHYESRSGNRQRAARWVNQTEGNFTLSVQNLSMENLTDLLQGTDSGAVAGASVTDEVVPYAQEGKWVFTAYPGISSVTVNVGAGSPGTLLVEGTDYTLDARNGGIYIIEGAPNIPGSTPFTVWVDYTHVGIEGLVEALTTAVQDYEVRFNGVNLTATDKPVIVELHRAQFSVTEELSLIGQEITSLTFTGALLLDENDQSVSIMKSNAV